VTEHVVQFNGPKPTITVVLGPTQNTNDYVRAHQRLTLAGHIVLAVGGGTLRSDHDLDGHPLPKGQAQPDQVLQQFSELQRRRIELADEVFVVNRHGRIGDGTQADIEYAQSLNKPVHYLEPVE
jgi:hypothetical protein